MSPLPTVRLIVVVCVRLPEVPVTVTLDVAGLGLNAALTPLGTPEAESVTWPVKPPDGVMVIVLLPVEPWLINKLPGEADRLKFAVPDPFTVSETVVECVVPLVPVIDKV